MTLRETTIAKLQQLPEPLVKQVSDFIDLIQHDQASQVPHRSTGDHSAAWAKWFAEVDTLEITPVAPDSDYQTQLLGKYRQQGLDL